MEELTIREKEVLELLCKGYNAAEMSRILGISPHTVEIHSSHVYKKASPRFKDLVELAISLGLDIKPAAGAWVELSPRLEEVLKEMSEAYVMKQATKPLVISESTLGHDATKLYIHLGTRRDGKYNSQHLAIGLYLERQRQIEA